MDGGCVKALQLQLLRDVEGAQFVEALEEALAPRMRLMGGECAAGGPHACLVLQGAPRGAGPVVQLLPPGSLSRVPGPLSPLLPSARFARQFWATDFCIPCTDDRARVWEQGGLLKCACLSHQRRPQKGEEATGGSTLPTPCAVAAPADGASLEQFKKFFLDKKLTKDTNVILMYRTGKHAVPQYPWQSGSHTRLDRREKERGAAAHQRCHLGARRPAPQLAWQRRAFFVRNWLVQTLPSVDSIHAPTPPKPTHQPPAPSAYPLQTALWTWQCGPAAPTGQTWWLTCLSPLPACAARCSRSTWAAPQVPGAGTGRGEQGHRPLMETPR